MRSCPYQIIILNLHCLWLSQFVLLQNSISEYILNHFLVTPCNRKYKNIYRSSFFVILKGVGEIRTIASFLRAYAMSCLPLLFGSKQVFALNIFTIGL